MTTATKASERYTVISADGHAGADLLDYKAYLPSRWHDEFDAFSLPPRIATGRAGAVSPSSSATESQPRCCSPTPCRRSSRRATSPRSRPPRRSTSRAGRGCRLTTGGSSTSVLRLPTGAPVSCRSSSTTSTTRAPRSERFAGRCRCAVACSSRRCRRTQGSTSSGTPTTSLSGTCARSSISR